MAQTATVLTLSGQVLAISAAGVPRLLVLGEAVQAGDTIRPSLGGAVELLQDDGQKVFVTDQQALLFGVDAPIPAETAATLALQTVIDALARGDNLDDLEAAAAGLAGGAGGEGNSFVRLLRIVEPVSPLAYEYAAGVPANIDEPRLSAANAVVPEPAEPPPPPPPPDLLPDARNDDGTASVLVERTQGTFNGDTKVMGAGEESFTDRLGHHDQQSTWLFSDASFKDQLADLKGAFTIEDKGAGGEQGDPAFVVTPQFTANAGDEFRFTASTELHPDDSFTASVYQNTPTGWQFVDDIAGTGNHYAYQFDDGGEYRVSFTVDCNTGGSEKAFATIDVLSDSFFYSGGEENVTLTDATGSILVNDTLGDGANLFSFEDGTLNPDGTVTVLGEHGTLTVEPDGDYTYTPNADSTGGVDTFIYTLADADSPTPDTDQATLTISVDHQTVTLPDDTSPESLNVGEAPTVLASSDVLDASSAVAPELGEDGLAGGGAPESLGSFDVLASNFNDVTDETVKRLLKDTGSSKNP